MEHSEIVLATIRCRATTATLNSLLLDFGVRARVSDTSHEFDLLSGTRGTEPEVNSEIVGLAFEALQRAQKTGALPNVEIVPAASTTKN
jgi:hypothetical protein